MASFLNALLPSGYRGLTILPTANNTREGRPGRWTFIANDDFKTWKYEALYRRSWMEAEGVVDDSIRFNEVLNFFLRADAYCFLVDDPLDNTAAMGRGTGIIKQYGGAYRLFKRYGIDGYEHPITRPRNDVTVSAGTLDFNTGVVTGINAPGTWTGTFLKPCVFMQNGLRMEIGENGVCDVAAIALEQQLEL